MAKKESVTLIPKATVGTPEATIGLLAKGTGLKIFGFEAIIAAKNTVQLKKLCQALHYAESLKDKKLLNGFAFNRALVHDLVVMPKDKLTVFEKIKNNKKR